MTAAPLLELRDLHVAYGKVEALHGIALEVPAGAIVSVIGPNGAGKTTLLSVLSGACRGEGTVRFQDEEVGALDAAERCRRGIARTHQVPRPFGGMTVFENVYTAATHGGGFGRAEAGERTIDALSLCGLLPLANRPAEALGLLERKRLELTRALATGPKLLLLDEIGGGLTDGEAALLVETIRSLHGRGIAIVWIEHIVHVLLQVVTRLVCMDAGRVLAQGGPRSVLKDPAVVAAYLGTPQ